MTWRINSDEKLHRTTGQYDLSYLLPDSSPDCRGITVAELQGIDFNELDFTNFMDDLMKNQKIPENDVLTNKTRERIKEIMSQQSAQ